MKRRTNPCFGQSALRAKQARDFFLDTLGHVVGQGYTPIQIAAFISQPDGISLSVERLGEEGALDCYLPVPWDQIAGIDVKYHGVTGGQHAFTLWVNGIKHDDFMISAPDATDMLAN